MAAEPFYSIAKLDYLRKIATTQAVVEARVLPYANGEIAKVLSVSAYESCTPSEVFTGEVRYNGKVAFKVIYADAEAKNCAVDYSSDFTDKIVSDAVKSGLKVKLVTRVLDTDIVSVTAKEIKLACVVEIDLMGVFSDEIKYLSSGGENIYTHDDRLDYSTLSGEADKSFILTDCVKDVKIAAILSSEASVVLDSVTAGTESVVFAGKICVSVIGETEDGMIKCVESELAFSEEISASGVRKDNVIEGSLKMTDIKTVLETEDSSSVLNIEYKMRAECSAFDENVINPIVDAFSVSHELMQVGESVTVYKHKPCANFNEKVDGNVTLDVSMPIVDSIMGVVSKKISVTNTYFGNDSVTFEGLVTASVLYYCAEQNSKNSVAVELPFSITKNFEHSLTDKATGCGAVSGMRVKIRRGNELDISASVNIKISVVNVDTKYIVTDITKGEAREIPTGALSIHIAKQNESLWDVAKALYTTPELVLLQNPHLTLPLSGGERIIIYRHLTRN